MASYYKILGLPEGANEEEVKKAYRRLAMEFHPDKNESDEAMARFIEITEAYEALQKGITESPEQTTMAARRAGEARRHDPEWRKEVAERFRKAKIKAAEEGLQYYHDYLKSYKYKLSFVSAMVAVLLAIIISIDFFTPGNVGNEVVLDTRVELMVNDYDTGHAMHDYNLILSIDESYLISYSDFIIVNPGNEIEIERSIIFNEPLRMTRTLLNEQINIDFENYLYDLYYVLMVLLLLPLLRFKIQKPDVSYYFFDFAIRSVFVVLMGAIVFALVA